MTTKTGKKSLESETKAPVSRKTKGKFIRRRILFKTRAAVGAKVFVAGSFNDWNPTAKPLNDPKGTGEFSCLMYLLPGTYEYKFVIDNVWEIDLNNENYVHNGMDSMNSVLVVE